MKILINDLITFATITSLNASSNYPASNLQHPFLHKRYQSALSSDLITITLEESENISCLFYAYTNATQLIFRFYMDYETLVYTLTVDDPKYIDALYFDTIYDISYITIEISGDVIGIYLGGVGTGLEYEWPNPKGDWLEPFIDNSTPTESPSGQSLQNYIEPLRKYNLEFIDNTRQLMNELKEIYKSIGIGLPLWIDLIENNHDFIEPLYGKITRFGGPQKNGRNYDFEMDLQEAR